MLWVKPFLRGWTSTLVPLKAEIEAAGQPISDSPKALKAFREIWALAVEEGRTQHEAIASDLRENVNAVATENERLEGIALAAQNRAAELEQAVSRAEAALSRVRTKQGRAPNQSQTALEQATAQAAQAVQTLAELQATRSAELATLQSELARAVGRAHELELKWVRAQALLEAKATT